MEPAEDRSRDDVLGRDTSDGREPTCPERRLHTQAAMGSAMVVRNVLLENTLGVGIIDDNDVVETIAAQGSVQSFADGVYFYAPRS